MIIEQKNEIEKILIEDGFYVDLLGEASKTLSINDRAYKLFLSPRIHNGSLVYNTKLLDAWSCKSGECLINQIIYSPKNILEQIKTILSMVRYSVNKDYLRISSYRADIGELV